MKLQQLALGLAIAVAGSAFAATSRDVTVTRVTPHGTVTKHVVRTSDRDMHRKNVRKVVVVHHPVQRHTKKVVIVHPARHHNHHATTNRTVVIHRQG